MKVISVYSLACPISDTTKYIGVTNFPQRRLRDNTVISNITNCLTGRSNTACGYKWKYTNV